MILMLAAVPLLFQGGESLSSEKIKIPSRLEFWTTTYLSGGFDKKYGIEVDPIPFATGIEVFEALVGETVQLADSGHVPMVSLLAKTNKVLVIGMNQQSDGSMYRMVVRNDATFKGIEDLKGRRIATRIGSGSYLALLRMLKEKGLSEKEFNILNSTPSEIVAAMEAGSVDAGIWFEPTVSIILHRKLGKVLLNFKGYAQSMGFWLVNRKFAEKNPDKVVRFLAGALDAQELLTNNPADAAKLVARGYAARGRGLPISVFEMGIPSMTYSPDVTRKMVDELKLTYRFLKEKGRLKGAEPNWNDVIRTDFLERAKDLRKKMKSG
jgi:sulfonate transport system substrate-binding protein